MFSLIVYTKMWGGDLSHQAVSRVIPISTGVPEMVKAGASHTAA